MAKNPWINPASHGGPTKQGQDAYDKSKGIVRTATGRGVPVAPKADPDIASANANKATAKANRTGDMSHHGAAQDLHMEASRAHKAAGNEEAAKAHWQAAQGHQKAVTEGGKVAPVTAGGDIGSGGIKDAAKATEKANAASLAITKGESRDHKGAADLHREAARAHDKSGNSKMAAEHMNAANAHDIGGYGTVAQVRALQTGAKGGSFYVTATGRKIYKKQ